MRGKRATYLRHHFRLRDEANRREVVPDERLGELHSVGFDRELVEDHTLHLWCGAGPPTAMR